jgi:hypothetical protein
MIKQFNGYGTLQLMKHNIKYNKYNIIAIIAIALVLQHCIEALQLGFKHEIILNQAVSKLKSQKYSKNHGKSGEKYPKHESSSFYEMSSQKSTGSINKQNISGFIL